MNKSYAQEERFSSVEDANEFECGSNNTPCGPAPLAGFFFSLGKTAERIPTQKELGLCKHFDGQKVADALTQTCTEHWLLHLQRNAQKAWGYI